MRLMGIDPGGTTGFAVYDCESRSWDRWQTPYDAKRLYNQINDWLGPQPTKSEPPLIICERFGFRRGKDNVDLTAAKVTGIIELICQQRNVGLVYQEAAVPNGAPGDTFWTDDRVKHLGLWLSGKVHAMDATKHLLYYRAFTQQETELFLLLKGAPLPVRSR